MKKLLLLAIVVLGISAVSFGQQSNILTTATASAKIIEKLTVSQTTGLNFGTMGAQSVETNVTVDPTTGARTGSADLLTLSPATKGEFHVTGQASTYYSISFSSEVFLSSLTVPTATAMKVSAFTASGGLTGHTLDTEGKSDFTVGATLTIGASQAAANDYLGQYTVTVLYE